MGQVPSTQPNARQRYGMHTRCAADQHAEL